MNRRFAATLCTTVVACFGTTAVLSQDTLPSYKADPDVYKVIFEDQNFRVIDVIRKKGVKDKAHGHAVPSVIYHVTDCTSKNYAANGNIGQGSAKAGTASSVAIVSSHSVENVGPSDCHDLIIEKK